MSAVHLPLHAEADAPAEIRALYERAHQKFGPTPLPGALLALGASTALFRDALLNLDRVIGEKGEAPRDERLTIAVGLAVAIGARGLAAWLDALAAAAGVPESRRKAAVEVAIACGTYNGYYRSRSLTDAGPLHDHAVQLRVTPLVQSVLDKRVIETLCVGVSVANGCKSCATGHVTTAVAAGATLAQIDDVLRLGAVLAGLAPLDT